MVRVEDAGGCSSTPCTNDGNVSMALNCSETLASFNASEMMYSFFSDSSCISVAASFSWNLSACIRGSDFDPYMFPTQYIRVFCDEVGTYILGYNDTLCTI